MVYGHASNQEAVALYTDYRKTMSAIYNIYIMLVLINSKFSLVLSHITSCYLHRCIIHTASKTSGLQ